MPARPSLSNPDRRVAGTIRVDVAEGTLSGAVADGVRAFKGVPYARAPIGQLRFASPQPARPWPGIRPAVDFAPAAPQAPDPGLFPGDPDAMPTVETSEDCLYLNIWAPEDAGPHPVLVWLHGGGQILGGTARPVYDGTAFAQAGIVCVTVGFRLGALGYLAVDEHAQPGMASCGNWALRDQIAALRWIGRNIEGFGGDPVRITLGGESAGGKCVAALMAAPAAAGLFHAAIVQSGGGDTVHDVAQARAIVDRWSALAAADLPTLRSVNHESILAAQSELLADGGPRFPFRPVYGSDLLPVHPVDAIRQGLAGHRPLLVGTCRDEMGPMLPDQRLTDAWPPDLLSHHTSDAMAAIEHAARAAFPGLATRELRRQLASAENYDVPALRLADANASTGAPTWAYRFDVPLADGPLAGSVPHTADLSSTWNARSAHDLRDPGPETRLHRIVAGFVRSHSVPWQRYDEAERSTALLGGRTRVTPHPLAPMLRLFAG